MRAVLLFQSSRCKTSDAPPDSNTPSTVARSAPCRTWSAPPRAPSVRLSASTISDFPLPVSPVRRLRPGPKCTRDSATSARSRTLSSFSMGGRGCPRSLVGDEWPAPAKLVAQPAVELLGRAETNHLETPGMRAAFDGVAGLDSPPPPAAVDPHLAWAA